jgi:Flp pilus assembly protein TadD
VTPQRAAGALLTCLALACSAPNARAQSAGDGAADAARHRELGVAHLNRGNLQDALTEFHTALTLNPNDAAAHDYLGVALGDSGQPEVAVYEFREAIRIDPALADAHLHLGLALERTGKPNAAVAEYLTALHLKPELVEARYGLSSVCARIGDLDGAIVLLRAIVQVLPEVAEPHYNLGVDLWNRYKGSPGLKHNEDLDAALHELRTAVRLEPRDPTFREALGQLLADMQDLPGAIDALTAAVDAAPGNPEYAYQLGLVLRPSRAIRGTRARIARWGWRCGSKAISRKPRPSFAFRPRSSPTRRRRIICSEPCC